jgi:uncharacterized BrkB/YihY/UPF0761 family membrane protein
MMGRLKSIGSIVKETGSQWSDDDAARLAASLALYTLLSIAPLVVIAVSVAGMVFGAEAARGQISQQISTLVGPEAGKAIEALVANAQNPTAVGRSATVSPFGAAGSLVALVVWVYYSAQILFMGAEFAQVYAARYGSRIVPSANAVPLDPKDKAAAKPESQSTSGRTT